MKHVMLRLEAEITAPRRAALILLIHFLLADCRHRCKFETKYRLEDCSEFEEAKTVLQDVTAI